MGHTYSQTCYRFNDNPNSDNSTRPGQPTPIPGEILNSDAPFAAGLPQMLLAFPALSDVESKLGSALDAINMPGHRDQFISDFDEIRERLDIRERLTLIERKLQEIEDALHIKL
jgi:hypothetical protein